MRITTISSSIASVVTRVIDSVAAAGMVRAFLHLTLFREHLGYWPEPCLAVATVCDSHACYQDVNPQPGNKPGRQMLSQGGTAALLAVSTPSTLMSVRATRRG